MSRFDHPDKVIHRIIETGLVTNDWVVIDFTLSRCWNKSRVLDKVNDRNQNYLQIATSKKCIKCVRTFIEHGIDVNWKDTNGNTSLHMALQGGLEIILRVLIEANANPFIRNKNGKLAIDIAKNNTVKDILHKYILKSSEIKLIRNLKKWKELFFYEENDLLLPSNDDNIENSKKILDAERKKPSLNRTDSGISSDSERSFKKQNSKSSSNLLSEVDKSSQKQTTPPSDKTKVSKIGGAIIGATLIPSFAKSPTENKSKQKNNFLRSHSTKFLTDGNQANEKTSNLKVSAKFKDTKKNTTHKKRKFDRKTRMSMPEIPSFASTETYI